MIQYTTGHRSCEQNSTDSLIVCEEHRRGSKVIFGNPRHHRVLKVHVDGCAIKEGPRCDFLVVDLGGAELIERYVELKGSDVGRALMQIEGTMAKFCSLGGNIRRICYVAATSAPKMTRKRQQYERRFRRDYNATLEIESHTIRRELT